MAVMKEFPVKTLDYLCLAGILVWAFSRRMCRIDLSWWNELGQRNFPGVCFEEKRLSHRVVCDCAGEKANSIAGSAVIMLCDFSPSLFYLHLFLSRIYTGRNVPECVTSQKVWRPNGILSWPECVMRQPFWVTVSREFRSREFLVLRVAAQAANRSSQNRQKIFFFGLFQCTNLSLLGVHFLRDIATIAKIINFLI